MLFIWKIERNLCCNLLSIFNVISFVNIKDLILFKELILLKSFSPILCLEKCLHSLNLVNIIFIIYLFGFIDSWLESAFRKFTRHIVFLLFSEFFILNLSLHLYTSMTLLLIVVCWNMLIFRILTSWWIERATSHLFLLLLLFNKELLC